MRAKTKVLLAVSALGALLLAALLPRFDAAQPHGLSVSRKEAKAIADAEARRLGIEVDQAWTTMVWQHQQILNRALSQLSLMDKAMANPVLRDRTGSYLVTYFRPSKEKWPAFGAVAVTRDGRVLEGRRTPRNEEVFGKADPEDLHRRASAFLRSRPFPGVTEAVFDSVRPTVRSTRTDTLVRYRVPADFPDIGLGYYIGVYFAGDQLMGWDLFEENLDGSAFKWEGGSNVIATLARYGGIYLLLAALLVRFLIKYHAGDVGVGAGAVLLVVAAFLSVVLTALMAPAIFFDVNMGSVSARATTLTFSGFKLMFNDVPVILLVFLAWTVGESYARERWGERLASFDAVLKRDVLNATVGRALLVGLLVGPAVASATLALGLVPVRLGLATPTIGDSWLILSATPLLSVVGGLYEALLVPLAALLFILAAYSRGSRSRRVLGFVLALASGLAVSDLHPPIEPVTMRLAFGVGGLVACAVLLLVTDVLTAATAYFSGYLLLALLPLLGVASGAPHREALLTLLVPLGAVLALATAGLATRREVSYSYEDLAPHVKRIAERERVRAEIEAANRIQAALLPASNPELSGTEVASHYRAATEIGGDYFDFLPLPGRKLGLVLGDVSGHGLTSGIVMAMTKAALLVQIGYDSRPTRVLDVLNETVMKTAPKRILMTFFYGVLDVETLELRYGSAGHLDPYVYRAEDGRLELLSAWGFPLGVKRREPFQEMSVKFCKGDRLILFSDGLIEAVDDQDEPFGFPRFEDVILKHAGRTADEIKSALLESVKRFTRNRAPEDDQTLVVLSFDRVPGAGRAWEAA